MAIMKATDTRRAICPPAFEILNLAGDSSRELRRSRPLAVPQVRARRFRFVQLNPNPRMQIRLLNAAAVRDLMPIRQCIDLMRQAMSLVATNDTIQPIRQSIAHPDKRGVMSMMPGYTAKPEWLGIKVISV